jgi:AAA+ superfamily predicted ATPase
MFFGGAGGTGKSRVIDAISAFCVSWHRESSLVKTALIGKAATLIGAHIGELSGAHRARDPRKSDHHA